MKRILNIILVISILTLFLYIPNVYAAPEKIAYTNRDTPVRKNPNTSSNNAWPITLDGWTRLEILDEVATTNTSICSSSWYKVRFYTTKEGYVCGDYVTVYDKSEFNKTTPTNALEQKFYDVGFTEPTYWPFLTRLQEKYPNWKFTAYIPNKDYTFDYIVKEESESLGRSLIQFNTEYYNGWKHVNSYYPLSNTFETGYTGGGSNWYAASKGTVAYYMDPRNFLNERTVFAFQTDGYIRNYHTLDGVQGMLNGTFMEGKPNITLEDRDRNISYAEIFIKAAEESNINPYSLVARVLQEVSSERTTIVTGTYPGYENYFNFYNIGATGEQNMIIKNGLQYAKDKGWNSEYTAIIGGANFIADGYVKIGQDNQYLQKWDIVGEYYFTNQYMQNIEAPITEGIKIYNNADLSQEYIFKIPVYKEMPAFTNLESPDSHNNYLKSLTVDNYLNNFNPEVYEYTIYVHASSKSVNISADAITIESNEYNNQTKISGTGTINLDNNITVHNVNVVSGNGKERNYKINIIKSTSVTATVKDILDNISVKYDEKYISGINLDTLPDAIINKVKEYNLDASTIIKDSNGNDKKTNLATGDKITITSGNETKTYEVVILGDLDGDGEITIADLLRLQKLILGSSNLSATYQKAGDINRDGKPEIEDLLKLQKHILGASIIVQ